MKRTLLLVFLLVASALGLLAIALNTSPKKTTTETTLPVAETVLSLTKPVQASGSAVFASNVLINTNGNKVTAVQIELSYDPQVLTNFKISAGTFFPENFELLNKVDSTDGKVTYALGVPPGRGGKRGSGLVAMINFEKLIGTTSAEISFDPKSLVTGEGTTKSVLREARGVQFDL